MAEKPIMHVLNGRLNALHQSARFTRYPSLLSMLTGDASQALIKPALPRAGCHSIEPQPQRAGKICAAGLAQ